MIKHTTHEEGTLAAIFLAGSLLLAIVVSLVHSGNHYSALVTVVVSIALFVTSLLAGAWTGAWIGDHRGGNGERWLEGGALVGFLMAVPIVFWALLA